MFDKDTIQKDAAELMDLKQTAADTAWKEAVSKISTVKNAFTLIFSSPEFHLTGSRRFGYNHLHSDFDFFIKESDMKRYADDVLKLGFKIISKQNMSADYGDISVAFIFELDHFIHLQVIKDAWFDAKVVAQDKFEARLKKLPDGRTERPDVSRRYLSRLWDEILRESVIPWSDSELESF